MFVGAELPPWHALSPSHLFDSYVPHSCHLTSSSPRLIPLSLPPSLWKNQNDENVEWNAFTAAEQLAWREIPKAKCNAPKETDLLVWDGS